MSSMKVSVPKSKPKSSKPTRFPLLPSGPHSGPTVVVTPQSDLRKSSEDARKRIQKRQLEISSKIQSVKKEFKNEVSVSKALKSKEGSFLREYYFKKYVTPSGKFKINKNFQVEESRSLPVNAYDNKIDLKEDEIANLTCNEINENLVEDKIVENKRNRGNEKILKNEPDREEEKACEIEESREEEKVCEFEESREEEKVCEIEESREEEKVCEIEESREEEKVCEVEESREGEKVCEIEIEESREEEKVCEIEESREEEKISENYGIQEKGEVEVHDSGQYRKGQVAFDKHENREAEKMSDIEEEHIPETGKNNEEETIPKIKENLVEDKTFKTENREKVKMPKMALLQKEQNTINEDVVADDLIQYMIDELETLINNNTPIEKKPKILESNYDSRPKKSKEAKMQEELLARLKETLRNQERAQKPEFKTSQEKRKIERNYDRLVKLHDILKEYKILKESLQLQHNTNPGESIFPPTSSPTIPTAMAFEEYMEINIEIPVTKLVKHQRLILIVDNIKNDEIEEGEQSLSFPISIIQRKDKYVDASTSTTSDNSTLLATPSFYALGSDGSCCSSYHTAPSETDTTRDSIEFVNLSCLADNGNLREAPEPTMDMKPSASSNQSFKEFIQSIYGITYEMEDTGKQGQNLKKSGRKEKPCFLSSNKSIGAFLLPICGQIFEIENEN